MRNINKVVFAGNVVRDAEFKRVLNFSVAVNSTTKNADDEYEDYPNFIDCVIFGKMGETLEEYLLKGTKVFVEGSLHQSRWEDKETGQNRSKLEVWVDNIEINKKQEESKSKKRSYR